MALCVGIFSEADDMELDEYTRILVLPYLKKLIVSYYRHVQHSKQQRYKDQIKMDLRDKFELCAKLNNKVCPIISPRTCQIACSNQIHDR